MSKVFISHSTQDRAFVEREIIPVLDECGVEWWYADTSIGVADEWVQSILDGLELCDWFLVVLSPRAVASEWVADEVHWACAHRKGHIVPVLLEDCKSDRLHIRLPRIQHVDFRHDRGKARARLIALWSGLATPSPAPKPEAAPAPVIGAIPIGQVARVVSDPIKEITNSVGMLLKTIPAGEFVMGSDKGDEDEKPPHRVRISRAFYLAAHTVTQGQYQQVTGTNPSQFKGSDLLPVEMVSWFDAVTLSNRLSQKEGLVPYYEIQGESVQIPDWAGPGYRLPTEAEWEYACRAGSTTEYHFGDDPAKLSEFAWYRGNSGDKTHPVGRKYPNTFGLFDMHGNIWEWCWDGWDMGYYAHSPVDDPAGTSESSGRVIRGGCWSFIPRYARSASRNRLTPDNRVFFLGFRLARGQSSR